MSLRDLTPAVGVLVLAGLVTVVVPAAVLAFAPSNYSHPAFSSGGGGGVNLVALAVIVLLPLAGYLFLSWGVEREQRPDTNR